MLLLWCDLARAAPMDVDPWSLVRVEEPHAPGAVMTGEGASVLLAPPETGRWRVEPTAEADGYDAWEAADALAVQPWRDAGVDGSGVKVAVFDYLYFGADLVPDEIGDVTLHDCGASPACDLPFDPQAPSFSWEIGSHGLACGEVIRDLAPGVELHLVRVNGQTTLENALAWAAREGVDLISMSLSFYGESYYDGTGPISDAVEALAGTDTLLVTSAGNSADEHWGGAFRDTDGDGLHEYDDGGELLPIDLSAGSNRIYVSWDDFSDCGRTDLDATVYDRSGAVVGRGAALQVPDAEDGPYCQPTERITAYAAESGWHWLQIRRSAGTDNPGISLFVRRGSVYNATTAGSLADPASRLEPFAVGAIKSSPGYLTNDIESYSSRGPTNAGLHKPDIAGPDGLSTSVYGASGFYGTSASTPAVTAALALLLSEDPTRTPREAADLLRAAALSDQTLWGEPDPAFGAGRARLPPPGNTEENFRGCAGRAAVPFALLWFLAVRTRRLEVRCDPLGSTPSRS